MAYAFSMDDGSVQAGVRRIAEELIDKATSLAGGAVAGEADPGEETIHELRKATKKLRALLQLVKPYLSDYRRDSAEVREAARALATARDAEVVAATFEDLIRPEEGLPAGVEGFRQLLADRRNQAARGRKAGVALADFRDAMKTVGRRARRWKLTESGFDALADGLEFSFGRARKAMHAAQDDPTPGRFHKWRGHAKSHWYHARLLAPAWPDLIGVHASLVGELGDLLGMHHDLCLLRQAVAEAQLEDGAESLLFDRMSARQAELAAKAFSLGCRVFVEKPGALGRRWRSYWHCWRHEAAGAAFG